MYIPYSYGYFGKKASERQDPKNVNLVFVKTQNIRDFYVTYTIFIYICRYFISQISSNSVSISSLVQFGV